MYDRPKPDVNLFIDPVRVLRCCGAALIRATPRKQAFVSFIPLNFADIAAISGTAFDTRGPMIHLPLLLLPSSFPFPSLPPWELGQARRLDPLVSRSRENRGIIVNVSSSLSFESLLEIIIIIIIIDHPFFFHAYIFLKIIYIYVYIEEEDNP